MADKQNKTEYNPYQEPGIEIQCTDNPSGFYFRPHQAIKVAFEAICSNIPVPEDQITYTWIYRDPVSVKKFVNQGKTVLLCCSPNVCGLLMTITVQVNFDLALRKKYPTLPNSIQKSFSFTPTTDQTIGDKVSWYPDQSEMVDRIYAELEVTGYNGKILKVRQIIQESGKSIWSSLIKIPVWNNQLSVLFSYANCGIVRQAKDTHYDLHVEVLGDHATTLKKEHKTYQLHAHPTVEELQTDCILQPVIAGSIETSLQFNNFSPCMYDHFDIAYTIDKDGKTETLNYYDEIRPTPLLGPCLIGGKRSLKASFKNYSTKRCHQINPSHKSNKAMFWAYGQDHPQELSLTVSGTNASVKVPDIHFDYSVYSGNSPASEQDPESPGKTSMTCYRFPKMPYKSARYKSQPVATVITFKSRCIPISNGHYMSK